MADGRELKPKSFRIDDSTAEKFKEIASAIGGNQQETMAKLIESYEFQSGKVLLTEKKADIEQFERHITAVTRMFMSSLEDNQNLTDTVRTEFDALLSSKDAVIQDLQSRFSLEKGLKESASDQLRSCEQENKQLKKNIETVTAEYTSKINNMKSMLEDKDKLNKTLTNSCSDLKSKLNKLEKEQELVESISSELASIKQSYEELSREKFELEKELKQADTAQKESLKQMQDQSELKLSRSLFELEKKYQEQLQALTAEKQKEIDQYQKKYFDLLQKIGP